VRREGRERRRKREGICKLSRKKEEKEGGQESKRARWKGEGKGRRVIEGWEKRGGAEVEVREKRREEGGGRREEGGGRREEGGGRREEDTNHISQVSPRCCSPVPLPAVPTPSSIPRW
jgi:hypothetical protein